MKPIGEQKSAAAVIFHKPGLCGVLCRVIGGNYTADYVVNFNDLDVTNHTVTNCTANGHEISL